MHHWYVMLKTTVTQCRKLEDEKTKTGQLSYYKVIVCEKIKLALSVIRGAYMCKQ